MGKKIHVTFDNFTYLNDTTESWMTPEEHAGLPELHDCHMELWENYLRARSAHQAACLAVEFALRYAEGTPQAEVQRQQEKFEKVYHLYCEWTNMTDQSGVQDLMERIGAIVSPEQER